MKRMDAKVGTKLRHTNYGVQEKKGKKTVTQANHVRKWAWDRMAGVHTSGGSVLTYLCCSETKQKDMGRKRGHRGKLWVNEDKYAKMRTAHSSSRVPGRTKKM